MGNNCRPPLFETVWNRPNNSSSFAYSVFDSCISSLLKHMGTSEHNYRYLRCCQGEVIGQEGGGGGRYMRRKKTRVKRIPWTNQQVTHGPSNYMICRLFSIYCFVLFLVSVRFATVSSPFRTNAIWWASTEGRTIPHSYHWEHETRALTLNRPEKNPPSLSSFSHSLSLCLSLRRFCMNARTGGVVICQSAVVSLGRTHVPVTANTSLCGTNAGQVRAPYSLCPRLTPLPFSFFSSQLFLLFFCQSMSILCLELALLLALSLSLSLSLSLFLSLPVSVLLSIVRFCVSLPFKNDNISQCSFLIGVFRSKEWLALLGGLCLCLIRNESRAYLWQVHTFPSHRLPKLSPQKS